jgi:DNA polymerase III sliding clamp (beta) subunit (PCNA family)
MLYNKINLSVAKIASKKATKPEITGVYFTKDKTVATDSFVLCEVSTPTGLAIEEFPTLLGAEVMAPDKFKPFIAAAFRVAGIKIPAGKQVKTLPILANAAIKAINENTVEFITTDMDNTDVKGVQKIDGEFPEYEPLWPAGEPIAEININAELLTSLLNVLGQLDDKNHAVSIKIYGDESAPAVLTAGNLTQKGRAMIMRVKK